MGRVALEVELVAERLHWRRDGSRVVLVHGAFDLLHPGHIRLLEQARSLGDVLVVAVENDLTLRAANAARRNDSERELLQPITPADERAEILTALAAVDFVVDLDGISLADFAERLQPDFLVRGADASGNRLPVEDSRLEEIVKRAGGRVTSIPLEPGYSTGSLVERIRQFRA